MSDSRSQGDADRTDWSRRDALKALGAAGLAGLAPHVTSASPRPASLATPERPNILFIVTDDHAQGSLCGYGGRLSDTPHLDRIADEGVTFENTFITNAVCGSSRASMITGKYSHAHGVRKTCSWATKRGLTVLR